LKTNLLYISPDFNYACGVSKHVYINLKHLSEYSVYKLFFITNKGDSLDRLENIPELNYARLSIEKDHKNPIKLIKDFFQLLLYCKKYKIDIIHTHHRYPELLSVLVSKIIRIKTITTVHSFVKGLKILSFRSDKIITVSKAVEDHLSQNYPHTKNHCTTIFNCIDESFYEPSEINTCELKKSLGYTESDKILLFAGRISFVKGIDIMIESFGKLPPELKIRLLIIGSIIDEQIRTLFEKKESNVMLLPPQKDLRPFYNISDLIVLPSREDPFPYVMLEAGAMKKPFVGSRTSGIAEFIEDGVDGLLFEPGNYGQLADKIIFLLNNPVQAELLSDALYQKVKRECDCEKYFEVLEQIYNQTLD
jgi:glycosyltransferase involved in cell wall biosynthesis